MNSTNEKKIQVLTNVGSYEEILLIKNEKMWRGGGSNRVELSENKIGERKNAAAKRKHRQGETKIDCGTCVCVLWFDFTCFMCIHRLKKMGKYVHVTYHRSMYMRHS